VLDKSGRAEDVALATLFLASDSSFWVTGVTLDVAGAGSWTDGCLVRGSER
jgi:NAD(P)-dependent dehydrogenase (short-subunit alcohol dehydrogenase family)